MTSSSRFSFIIFHLHTIQFKKPRIPVISNVDAKPHSDPAEIKQILLKQVTSPVQWETTMTELVKGGLETAYELGPGKVSLAESMPSYIGIPTTS